jgi:hypothetical protein
MVLTGYVSNSVQSDARYVSSNGKCPFIDVTLCSLSQPQLALRDIDCSAMGWSGNDATRAKNLANSLPLCHYIQDASGLDGAITSDRLYVDKDMREALRFSYQMHFITYDRDITIHSGITMNLYYNDYGYKNGSYVKPGKPIYVGYNGDIRGDEKLSYQSGDVLGSPTITMDASNRIKIAGFTVGKNTSYDGIALIWPNRSGDAAGSIFEDPYIIYEYKTPIKASDGSFAIPDIYLNFFNGKILNKTK